MIIVQKTHRLLVLLFVQIVLNLTVIPIVYAYFIFLFKDIFLVTLLLFYNVFSTNIHIPKRLSLYN